MKNTLNEYNVIALNFRECIDGYLLQKIKYPILAADYKTGLVCYFDILGFSSKVYSESKIGFIQDLVFDMQRIINTHELNKLSGNVLFISDSVFYTVEHDENTEAGALINILNLVCLMRKMVVMHVKTDIRCCIAYGNIIDIDYLRRIIYT